MLEINNLTFFWEKSLALEKSPQYACAISGVRRKGFIRGILSQIQHSTWKERRFATLIRNALFPCRFNSRPKI